MRPASRLHDVAETPKGISAVLRTRNLGSGLRTLGCGTGRRLDLKRGVRTEARRAEVLARGERGEISTLDAAGELGVGRSRVDQLLLARRRSVPPTPAVGQSQHLV